MATYLELPDELTIGEAYDPAMKVESQEEADAYFEALVERQMRRFGKSREEAEAIERSNLGYYAGYYDGETRERVEQLFRCAHPIFGAIAENGPPTAEQAMLSGVMASMTAADQHIVEAAIDREADDAIDKATREAEAFRSICKALLPLSPRMRGAVLNFAQQWAEDRRDAANKAREADDENAESGI